MTQADMENERREARAGAGELTKGTSFSANSLSGLPFGAASNRRFELPPLTPRVKAELLYEYCVTSEKKVSESVHSLFIIAEHYAKVAKLQEEGKPVHLEEIEQPEQINGIPRFFNALTAAEKSEFCYNQVTEQLSREALPVTVESLRATKRLNPDDPASSFAGRFVRRVTQYVSYFLAVLFALYVAFIVLKTLAPESPLLSSDSSHIQGLTWVAFGCIGALVHLLNHALTTTRLQTFEVSEERKIGPRLLLGGMFGFVLPWILSETGPLDPDKPALGTIAAFFGGYSVRFSIGLLERVLSAVFPETKPKP